MTSASSWPAVSVVITCFNLEAYICEAIQSVQAQDYPGEIEIVVVDDASGDGSVAKIREFSSVRLLEKASNGGVLLAMLDGLSTSSNELIFLLDGDDVWEPSKLRLLVQEFLHDPAIGFATHSLSHIDGSGQPLNRANRVEQGLTNVAPADRSEHMRKSILEMRDDVWLGSAVGFRRSLVDPAGFAEFAATWADPANCYQDWPLAYWIAAQSDIRLAYVDQRLFRYRLHGANHSGDAASAPRATRNFQRAANTLDAMVAIGERFQVTTGLPELRQRAQSYRYLAQLYRGRSWSSVGKFIRSIPSFVRRRLLVKEIARLVGVLVLGPNQFARIASRRSQALNLPTS